MRNKGRTKDGRREASLCRDEEKKEEGGPLLATRRPRGWEEDGRSTLGLIGVNFKKKEKEEHSWPHFSSSFGPVGPERQSAPPLLFLRIIILMLKRGREPA